jgi:hypothetical protein
MRLLTFRPVQLFILVSYLGIAPPTFGHGPAYTERPQKNGTPARHIEFPDTADYQTLVLDLHTHSVFSDGHVWPTVRVSEALRDGLDGLAITEHLEYQPHLSDIPHPDRNRAYEEAVRAAQGHPLTVIPGVEITRIDETGHINAVFVKDANSLVRLATENTDLPVAEFATREEAVAFTVENSPELVGAHSVEVNGKTVWRPYEDPAAYQAVMNFSFAVTLAPRNALEAAKAQGAFVFWNHPSFERLKAELPPFHKSATRDGLLHGIEIANGDTYYPNAHRLALKHDLALIGVSDVHELIEWDYRPEADHNPGHRPVTLVLAEGNTTEDMQAALFARRTIVWWKELLIGREAHLAQLLEAALSIESVDQTPWGIRVNIRNRSDAPFQLMEVSKAQLTNQTGVIQVAPNGVTGITMNVASQSDPVTLEFEVLNALIAPAKPAKLTLSSESAAGQ